MSNPIIFDRLQVRRQRDRAVAGLPAHDFLLREGAERLADRLLDVTREFSVALDIGCHGGELAALIRGRFGIRTLLGCDLSAKMAACAARHVDFAVVADEESLPFAEAKFDLAISNLSLHWVNDLPGALLQIRRALRPDGLFLASLLGGETLRELRSCLLEAELAEEGGAGPRISPFVDVRDAGALLQRAGFALPVADIDEVTVTYGDAFALLRDLRGMGEGNAVMARRRRFSRRATLLRALQLYRERHQDGDGRLRASFQILTLTGWSPSR